MVRIKLTQRRLSHLKDRKNCTDTFIRIRKCKVRTDKKYKDNKMNRRLRRVDQPIYRRKIVEKKPYYSKYVRD